VRGRLVLLAVSVTAMVITAFSLPLGLLVRDLARDRAIAEIDREANSIARTLAVLVDPSTAQLRALVDGNPGALDLTIVASDGQIVGDGDVNSAQVALALQGAAISGIEQGGQAVYVPVVTGAGVDLVVRGWVGPDRLTRNVAAAWSALAALAVVLIGLSAWLADRLGRTMVQPIEALAAAADAVGKGALGVSVEPNGPREVLAVGAAFNRLVSRVGDLVASEREEVADLSHRLRTPLAALRLDAEALGSVEGADEVRADAAYLERAVDDLIMEARRPIREAGGRIADLNALLQARTAFWAPLAADQDRVATVQLLDGPVWVAASDSDLQALIDALLGNIIAHTPEGSDFSVVLSGGPNPVLVIADEGPGFPRLDVIDRGASEGGSSGLGLDIVRRTAVQAGGGLEIANPPEGGARVTVRFRSAESSDSSD